MNERIRKLAKQNNLDITIDGMGYGEGDIESLVKLIVRDCVDIINHRADTSADYLDSKKANDHARQVQRDCAATLERVYELPEVEIAE